MREGWNPEAVVKLPLQVTFAEMPESDAVEADIRKHAEKLDEFCDHVISCRVTVAAPGRHKQQGKQYCVHIDIKVPGHEIASTHNHEHEDLHVAIRDAFAAVQRRLQDYVRRQRGQAKVHQPQGPAV